ncbi:sigma-70 family RNA polymerase sigma factor [Chitinophaga horti]|uniref:Sigma-70 family RNA polymerase sigma factor n=1 Tax=Chitinophaga horti TaxID=2920382 RepID=A0ABY6IXY6_9BACT|nr:sigma-70 family RNA polymerase sigma factor [Chitinophaga horti]UYQ92247.1 sigma-70 family RNA polymerase sigma factor [Chitinophaga horti]
MNRDIAVMSQHVDELLWEYIRQDDHKAFEVLFVKYYRELTNTAFYYNSNSEEAEEIAADVLHSLWQKRATLEISSSLKAYLSVATRNATFNILRKKILVIETLTDAVVNEHRAEATDHMESKDIEEGIDRALRQLTARQREIFRLHRFQEYHPSEIAQLLQLSEGTVNFQLHKANKRLKEYFKGLIKKTGQYTEA